MKFWICLTGGFLLSAFGQPAWIPGVGMFAAAGGYALFWTAMLQLSSSSRRFLLSLVWYAFVQAIQLSWMTSTFYMGPFILGVYVFLLLGLGVQFGLFSCLLRPKESLSQVQCAGLAGYWVFSEWIRLYFLSGFTWNPVGIALADSRFSIQLATLFGIYGLSFWVIWTNLAGLNAFFLGRSTKNCFIWLFLVFFPYGFGWMHQTWVERWAENKGQLRVALVETGLKVEEKYRDKQHPEAFIPALDQWERVWKALDNERFNMIVLPEAAFPYGAYRPFCSLERFEARWSEYYGEILSIDFSSLAPPFAFPYEQEGNIHWMVTNSFLAQCLANHYGAEVIIGLDAEDELHKYNAAFQFHPGGSEPERYEKRILAPVGEYIPLRQIRWLADFFAKKFGIEDSFDAGKEAKLFSAPIPVGVVICLEEIYSGLVRGLRKEGAELFVSLSNDVWFPSSRLPQQHFDHGRIRAVENGVFLLRSSNMGVTGGIDCFGQSFGGFSSPGKSSGVVSLSIPLISYPTLYTLWGNGAILFVSSLFFLFFLAQRYRRKDCP